MSEKIFISYNHKDEKLIDTIARRLEIEFGRNNIFYDKWSIQPGDSIIGKMNVGLSEFTAFFFFISPNSLVSKMVELEWQTALNRAVNNNLKFIPVRIADCNVPTILSDRLYIDLYGDGLDSAVEMMRCIIKGDNAYKPLEDVQNLQAYIKEYTPYELEITIEATLFVVHNPVFAIGVTVPSDLCKIQQISEGMVISGNDIIETADGTEYNAKRFGVTRSLTSKKPFVVKMTLDKSVNPFTLAIFVSIEKNDEGFHIYQNIPTQRR